MIDQAKAHPEMLPPKAPSLIVFLLAILASNVVVGHKNWRYRRGSLKSREFAKKVNGKMLCAKLYL